MICWILKWWFMNSIVIQQIHLYTDYVNILAIDKELIKCIDNFF